MTPMHESGCCCDLCAGVGRFRHALRKFEEARKVLPERQHVPGYVELTNFLKNQIADLLEAEAKKLRSGQ